MLVASQRVQHALSGIAARESVRLLRPRLREPSRYRSLWTSKLGDPVQVYVSSSSDPFVNLSVEHHLLEATGHNSTVLLFYTNRPSIVIGRNQNPWYETDLARIQPQLNDGSLSLVRRRSGGGTVYHDAGNINWTVICPKKTFARDTHAEMVVQALRSPQCGVARARVNERHDIVLDQGDGKQDGRDTNANTADAHSTPWTSTAPPRPLKCSGSAFKITRHRALHHGTCLLRSGGLETLRALLSSPGKPYLDARGVESVSSPVGNTGVAPDVFMAAVRARFEAMYSPARPVAPVHISEEEALADARVRAGDAELRGRAWTFAQTPRFRLAVRANSVPTLRELAPLTVLVEVEKACVTRIGVWWGEECGGDGDGAAALGDDSIVYDARGQWPLYDASWQWEDMLARLEDDIGHGTSKTLGAWLGNVLPIIKPHDS